MTVDEIINQIKFSIPKAYREQPVTDEEMLVAEIERLRAAIETKDDIITRLHDATIILRNVLDHDNPRQAEAARCVSCLMDQIHAINQQAAKHAADGDKLPSGPDAK